MKQILFLILLTVFVMSIVFPAHQYTGIAGLTVKNITVYLVGMLLIIIDSVNGRLSKINIPSLWFFVLFLTWSILSLIYVKKFSGYDIDLLANARKVKTLVFEPIFMFGISFIFVESKENARKMLLMLLVFIGIVNLLSIISSFAGLNLFTVATHYIEKARFTGMATNPNKTAYLLCVLIPLQYYLITTESKIRTKRILSGLILFEVMAILMTGSRGGLIALMVEIIFIAHITNNMKKMISMAIILLPVLIIVLIQFKGEYLAETLNRVEVLISGSLEDASASRFTIWRALIDSYTETWQGMLLGKGFGTVEYIGTGIRSHNLYMEILVEFGLIGLGVFIAFIVHTYKRVRKMGYANNNFKNIVMLCCAIVLWAWFFTTLLGILELICLTIGLAIAYLRLDNSNEVEINDRDASDNGSARILSYRKNSLERI